MFGLLYTGARSTASIRVAYQQLANAKMKMCKCIFLSVLFTFVQNRWVKGKYVDFELIEKENGNSLKCLASNIFTWFHSDVLRYRVVLIDSLNLLSRFCIDFCVSQLLSQSIVVICRVSSLVVWAYGIVTALVDLLFIFFSPKIVASLSLRPCAIWPHTMCVCILNNSVISIVFRFEYIQRWKCPFFWSTTMLLSSIRSLLQCSRCECICVFFNFTLFFLSLGHFSFSFSRSTCIQTYTNHLLLRFISFSELYSQNPTVIYLW